MRKVILSYPGLPWHDIHNIYQNKFKPLDLYKFRYYAGRGGDKERARIIKDIDKILIFKKKGGLYKDFGFISKIWFCWFLNYVVILLGFNIITYFFLFEPLFVFHARIIKFSDIYSWKDAILSLTIDYYIEILYDSPFNSSAWFIL